MAESTGTTDGGLVPGTAGTTTEYVAGGRRRRRKSRLPALLAVLVALAVLVGGFYVALTRGVDWVADQFGSAEDFAGPGSGQVLVEVQPGDSTAAIGRTLKEQGVVASVDAFLAAAAAEPDSQRIQPGFYELREEMAAADAVAVLIDPDNLVRARVTIPEGLTVEQILDVLADGTDFPRQAFERALAQPDRIGLPDYAGGEAEGYLFPATYDLPPDATPRSILRQMVDRWRQAADDAGLEEAAERLGYTPHELMTIASLIEAESPPEYAGKVSRVIYNRLETDATNRLLQLDATVNYASGRDLGARTTAEDRAIDSPYNTYVTPGLPPGPIEAPGDASIQAATAPEDGPWIYYVTVNLATGETKFAETLSEHNVNVAELDEYCRTQSDRC